MIGAFAMPKEEESRFPLELSEEDQARIREIFFETVVPKLKRLDARVGTISCEFAGTQYRNWMIRFNSTGSGFDIVDFEYDEEGEGLPLDL